MAYNPNDHTPSNKPYGVQGKPDGARAYFYDKGNTYVYRQFVSKSEVTSYFTTELSRRGNFTIVINSTGTINEQGYIQGGIDEEWWFVYPYADEDLILKNNTSSIAISHGKILSTSGPLEIDWNTSLVPGSTQTYAEKHGDILQVIIQTLSENPLIEGGFSATLSATIIPSINKLIIDNQSLDVYYVIMGKAASETPIPPDPGNNYVENGYIENGYVQ